MILKQTFGTATDKSISAIEKKYNVTLSSDYKDFLNNSNGGTCEIENEKNNYIVDGNTITLDFLYGIKTCSNADIEHVMEIFEEDLLAGCLIIGDDLMGGQIVIICSGDDRGIYYWDHGYNFETSDDELNMYWICDEFSDL